MPYVNIGTGRMYYVDHRVEGETRAPLIVVHGAGATHLDFPISLRKLHSLATKELNRRENQPGRTRLWQNYRETRLTHQHSYLARLNYVHHNAVHHGLVRAGCEWSWCSARAFQAAVTPAWYKTVTSFRYEEIAEKDEDVM